MRLIHGNCHRELVERKSHIYRMAHARSKTNNVW